MDQGGVAGKKRRLAFTTDPEHRVEPAQRLPRAGNASDEQRMMQAAFPRRVDRAEDRLGGAAEIMDIGAGGANIRHPVPAIKCAGGIDDAWHRPVGSRGPRSGIERPVQRGRPCPQIAQQAWQAGGGGVEHPAGASEQQRPGDPPGHRGGGDKDRHDRHIAARAMEILQIERVVLHLAAVISEKRGGAGLEFQHQDRSRRQQNRVYPPPQPQHRELQHQLPFRRRVPAGQGAAKARDRDFPGADLLWLVASEPPRIRQCQFRDQRIRVGLQE